MQWTFKLGGEDVTFTILEDVAAVKPTSEFSKTAAITDYPSSFGEPVKAEAFRVNAERAPIDIEVFATAGWQFVSPLPTVAFAAETRTSIPQAESVRQVFLTKTNHMMIGTGLATVRLHESFSEAEVAQILEEDRLEIVYRLASKPNAFEVRLLSDRPLPEIIDELQAKTDRYVYAEPSLLQVITGRKKPTDPDYSEQWQHHNDGKGSVGPKGVRGADLHSEGAWDITRGKSSGRPVRIAIIDNGMQVSHPEFEGGIFRGGHFQATGVGEADFVPLLNPATSDFPDLDHGTFCMGMAGARMNNELGGCGSAPESDLMPIACFFDEAGTQTTLARAIEYAVADGADVISCSLDTESLLTSGLKDAIEAASAEGRNGLGIPVFWAVSNDHVEISLDRLCSHPRVIPVGRSNRRGLNDGSAFGPELDFLAPGTDVFSTRSESQFNIDTGTSFATPLAAGVAALVISVNPDLKSDEVRQILRETCDKPAGMTGHHDEFGFGLLNAERAVKKSQQTIVSLSSAAKHTYEYLLVGSISGLTLDKPTR